MGFFSARLNLAEKTVKKKTLGGVFFFCLVFLKQK